MSDMRSPTVAIQTLGCKLNIADSEAMAHAFQMAGWRISKDLSSADAVIINTCSVTRAADGKSRHAVRLAKRKAPAATVAVTGCLLETASPQTINDLGADLVYRQPDQVLLVERLTATRPGALSGRQRQGGSFRVRAFVAAQNGCNDVCAFCIVPRTRGRERSKPIEEVVAEVQAREAEGVMEVVITGTQLGAYGRDQTDGRGLRDLLSAVLAETRVPRIRMSSVQPQDLSDELIELWKDPRLCRHFHLALQSGSETVLRRMRRRYDPATYRSAVERLRRRIPDVAVTTDIIAGFPGETEAEFRESFDFCSEVGFAAMHVFPYSPRPGTVAARMTETVDEATKKERVRALIELGGRMGAGYRKRFLGHAVEVLWESRTGLPDANLWEGLTDTYVRVVGPSLDVLRNQTRSACLTEIEGDVVRADIHPFDFMSAPDRNAGLGA